jgi:uncharacterized membrane protein (DUF4010 family)
VAILIDLPQALLRVLVAGLAGGLIGIERERSQAQQNEPSFAGARTFPLIAILGASLTVVTGAVGPAVVAGFIAIAALIVASYLITSRGGHPGTTTETAALATYWIGVMAGLGSLLLAGAVAIVTGVLLVSKERLDTFGRTLTREELTATLTLAVIAAVILPVLPDAGYGPWGVWNPRKLWTVVVLVCGLSFLAFIGMRVWGAARGLYVSGLLGGLVSSTATTVSLAGRSREAPGHAPAFAVAAGIASLVMVLRVAFLAAVTGPDVMVRLLPFLVASAASGALAIALLARRARPAEDATTVANPFRLASALKFGAVFAVVLLLVEAAQRRLGPWGVLVAAVLSGLTDVDAITIALASSTSLPVDQAATGIAFATLSNTVAKLSYAAWLGAPRFRRILLVILGAALTLGALTLAIVGPRP